MPVVELRDRLLVGITSDGIGHERLTRLAAGRGVALLWRPVTHMRPRQGAARRLVELLASRGVDWVAVTSAAAAPAVSQAWAEIAAARTPPRLAAVGPATAAALPDCPVLVNDGELCDLSQWRPGDNGALFAPQGGLRISVRGLARVGRMLLNGGTLDGVRILSSQSVDTLLAPHWRFNGRNGSREGESATICTYGLAAHQIPTITPGCRDDMGTRGALLVGHSGNAYGLRSGIWIDRKRGRGVAYFVTGLADEPPRASGSNFRAPEEAAFQRTYALFPY